MIFLVKLLPLTSTSPVPRLASMASWSLHPLCQALWLPFPVQVEVCRIKLLLDALILLMPTSTHPCCASCAADTLSSSQKAFFPWSCGLTPYAHSRSLLLWACHVFRLPTLFHDDWGILQARGNCFHLMSKKAYWKFSLITLGLYLRVNAPKEFTK